MSEPLDVFFSYAHQDKDLRDELDVHLAILKRQGKLRSWHDRQITGGQEWAGEIDDHLKAADIILLLVSPTFVASDYCWDVELQRAIERHEAGEARIVPIILRPVDWSGAPFGKLQALPEGSKPITTWPDRDEAFLNVVEGLRAVIEDRQKRRAGHPAPASTAGSATSSAPVPVTVERRATPAVIRTLLLTDLVGSTQLVERLGDQRANEISEHHDRLARDLIGPFGGREIDKTDGFLMLFERPVDAVRYALAYHDALARLSEKFDVDLQARAGIHLGEVILRENSTEDIAHGAKPVEVEGLAKPTAARIMSLAAGGQTLLTRGALDLARRAAVDNSFDGREISWRSHGPYQLKGVDEPIGVFEVGVEGRAPLKAPPDSDKAHQVHVQGEGTTLVMVRTAEMRKAARDAGRRRRISTGTAILLLLAVVAAALSYRKLVPSNRLALDERSNVAVLDLQAPADAPHLAWVPECVAELITFELEAAEGLTVMAPPKLDSELPKPQPDGSFDRGALASILRATEAGVIVHGRLRPAAEGAAEEMQVDLWVQDTRTGKRVRLEPETGHEAELPAMSARLSRQLHEVLGTAVPELGSESTALTDPEAERLHTLALGALRVYDAQAALEHLDLALGLEPAHPGLHRTRTEALHLLGRTQDARTELQDALARAAGWPRQERLHLRVLDLEVGGQPARAAALMQALWYQHVPDEVGGGAAGRLEDGLRLAHLLSRGGRSEQSLDLLSELRAWRPDDPRLDLAAATAARRLSGYERQLEAARRAIATVGDREVPFLKARARHLAGDALRRLGRLDEAKAELEAARNVYAWAGHAKGEADAANDLGNLLWTDQHNLVAAKASFERAARLYDSIGNRRGAARMLVNRAMLLRDQGNLDAAIEIYHQALDRIRGSGDEVAELATQIALAGLHEQRGQLADAEAAHQAALDLLPEVEERVWQAYGLRVVAEFYLRRGRLADARKNVDRALDIQQQIGDATGTAAARFLLARILEYQGELGAALELYQAALAVHQQSGNQLAYALALRGIGDVQLKQGERTAARASFRETLEIQDPSTSQQDAAETRLSLARLLIEEQQLGEAEERAREALDSFQRGQAVLEETAAREILARVLNARGRGLQASREIDAARAALEQAGSSIYRLPLEITAARVLAGRGDTEQARGQLQSLLAQATTGGFVGLELEIQLAQGEIDLASGNARAARALLRSLAEDARLKGFGLIARKASALQG